MSTEIFLYCMNVDCHLLYFYYLLLNRVQIIKFLFPLKEEDKSYSFWSKTVTNEEPFGIIYKMQR